jgi:hypothetical protein
MRASCPAKEKQPLALGLEVWKKAFRVMTVWKDSCKKDRRQEAASISNVTFCSLVPGCPSVHSVTEGPFSLLGSPITLSEGGCLDTQTWLRPCLLVSVLLKLGPLGCMQPQVSDHAVCGGQSPDAQPHCLDFIPNYQTSSDKSVPVSPSVRWKHLRIPTHQIILRIRWLLRTVLGTGSQLQSVYGL